MKLKPVSLLIGCSLASLYCHSQNEPIGHWTDYLSYHQGITVCQGGGNIYCCSSSGVYAYNLSDNSLQRYNKVTGLSDIGCTVARYNTYDNALVIGYSDGNIDVMTNNRVVNIPDLKNSSALGSKTINNIYFSNDTAYISCAQGILVVDLSQDIILDEYIIGPDETTVDVYSTDIFNDSIFAATADGIYKISRNDPNPDDYTDWEVIGKPLPTGVYNEIVTCGNKMYASFSTRLTNTGVNNQNDTLFVYNSGKWSRDPIDTGTDNIYSLECSTVNNIPYLVYSGNYNVSAFDSSGNPPKIKIFDYKFQNPPIPRDAILDNNMKVWIADANYGLVKSFSSYSPAQSYYPSGPYSNSIFAIATQGSNMYIAPGAYTQHGNPLYIGEQGVSEYSDNSWYRLIDNANPDTLFDLCCLAIDPQNPLHAYAGSFDDGLIEYNNYAITNVYGGGLPSTLQNDGNASNYTPPFYAVRVGGVAFDPNNNLWLTNSGVASNEYLSVKKTDGTWQAFNFSGIPNLPLLATVTNLIVTQSGAKWMIFPGAGILAYQDNGTFAAPNASNSVFMNESVNNGDLPSLNIYCLTQDQNGAIWVGTDAQVVVFYSPDNIFNGPGGWDAQNVYVQQTGYTQYLMQGQYTSCIAIDGANRKWIGTLGGGVFLMSADGTQQILNFTVSNSPLPSNNILSIAINQVTGEVFFGTDQGLVSYRGDATQGASAFGNVYVYPDPIPHGYAGPIAIKNLVANSDIKITTVSGEIVYHTIALGGQAVWYGTNFNGERVQTGVYLVFCTSPDGSQSFVTKLLLIN